VSRLDDKINGAIDRKAHPDEKGTESQRRYPPHRPFGLIARPIPMKRELKVNLVADRNIPYFAIARPIPMKRELKDHIRSDEASKSLRSQGPSR